MNVRATVVIFFTFTSLIGKTYDEYTFSKRLHDDGIKNIEYWFLDPYNTLRSIFKPIADFEKDVKQGIAIDGSSLRGFRRITESDMILKPDLNASFLVPWTSEENRTIGVMCDMFTELDDPYISDPRYILKKVLQELNDMFGLIFLVGPEVEFYVLKNKADRSNQLMPIDNDGYCEVGHTMASENVKSAVLRLLDDMGCPAEKLHHEVGPGQYEIVLRYCDALKMADIIAATKHALRSFSNSKDVLLSTMAKIFKNQNGSGMHVHFSLFDEKTGANAFHDQHDPMLLSPTAKSFIAGVLHHLRSIALILNSTPNSYKRLVRGFEAPIFACAGSRNRSAAVRIPYVSSMPKAVRAELRSPDPMCNPYLAFAAILAAGLDGMKNNMELNSKIINENLYEFTPEEIIARNIAVLPQSLEEAINEFEHSELMRNLFGEYFFKVYADQKKAEAQRHRLHVTDLELEEYL